MSLFTSNWGSPQVTMNDIKGCHSFGGGEIKREAIVLSKLASMAYGGGMFLIEVEFGSPKDN